MSQFEASVSRTRGQEMVDAGLRAYLNKVYMLMATAMVVTFGVAYYVGNNADLLAMFFTGPVRWAVMFAPLIFVFALSAMINSISAPVAQVLLYAFGGVMGLSIAWIFHVFTDMSIAQTFLATSVAFIGLSIYGYTTNSDLSGWGRFLVMAVIGILVVSLINIFLVQSGMLQMIISAVVVLVFSALTAYDTQRLKNEYLEAVQYGSDGQAYLAKGAVMGALNMYLNFINIFMALLQFMGASEE